MKAFLRVIRLPNVITAASNSLAGAFCAGVSIGRWQVLVALAFASMTIYAAGILFNDLFDLEEDRRERPDRPLPSGDVSLRVATVSAIVLISAGLAVAWSLGFRTGAVATVLVAAVLGYDLGLKRTFLGPWVMGLCRGANLGLGLVAAESVDVSRMWAVAGYVVYVAGVTYVSRQETYAGRTSGLRAGFALIVAGIFGVLVSIVLYSGFRLGPQNFGMESGLTILAIFLLFLLLKTLSNRLSAALADPAPATIGGMVKTGVISLPLLDFAQTLSIAGLMKAVVIAVLWLVARAAATRLYST
ncbi:4-hydroxybenzoate polyprenyltransferase [bacterium]|nr:4-hydroxybenzoate polyprenyltransferase [bacterium]